MSGIESLPDRVVSLMESAVVADFATVSMAGVPINTPAYYFPSDDLATLDVATGMTQPAKAERARRNPKAGLLIDGKPDEPVIAVRGYAAVRDADLEANVVRYLSETGFASIAYGLDWSEARKAVHYWARIIIETMPSRIFWWENQAALDGAPNVWEAPAGTVFPASDPAPSGAAKPSKWPRRPWQDVAGETASSPWPATLTVLDEDGFPMSMRARGFERTDRGFRLDMPGGIPWRCVGSGTVTFAGYQTFVGKAFEEEGKILFDVERALPQLPSTKDHREVLQPKEVTLRNKMERLEFEVARRGRSVPFVPEEAPPLTRLANLRRKRIASDAPITGMKSDNRQGHS